MVLDGTSTNSPSINHDVLLHCQRSADTEESRQLCQGLQRYPLPVLHPAGLDVLLPSGPPASPLCRRQLTDDTLQSNSMMDASYHNLTRDSPLGLGIPHNNNKGDDNDNSIYYTNWPASAQQRSPFRFAAHDSFHRALRTQSGGDKRKRTMTDRLCHGWGGEQADGDSPNQQRAEKGKRSRSPTPPPPLSSSQPVVVVEAASAAAPRLRPRDNHNDISISSVSVLNGPFSDRLLENDALLDDLLMPSPPPPRCGSPLTTLHPPTTTPSVTTSFSEVVVMAPCRSHTTLQAVGNAAERTLTRDGEEDELKQKKKKTGELAMTVKELKQQLARAGLLTVGTKTELLHRWQLYQEKIQEEGNAGITHTNTNNNSIVSNVMETSLVSADATFLWPPPPTAAAAGGPLLPSSSSPPRTIFRLCSQPSPSRVTAEESVAIPPPTPSRRHVVPTPDAFLDDFQTGSNTNNNNGIIKNTTRSNNNNNSSSDVIATWQLLVDNRERVHGKHDGMLAVLQKQQVPCRSCVLPCGDFMINIAVASSSSTSTGHHDETTSLSVALPPPVGQHGEEEGGEEGEANIPLHSHLLPIVVERKTLADLDASIKGSRYLEQRRLLDQSPFAIVVWLIEGMESSFSGSSFNNNSSSTTREGKDLGRFAALSEQQRRVDSACASLSQQKRFVVVRTRNLQESAVFLRQLALSAMEQLRTRMVESTTTPSTSSQLSFSPLSSSTSTLLLSSLLLQTDRCLAEAQALQKALRAQTAFPRMLLSIRGCSSGLACMLAAKYGSLHALWALLQLKGPAACDEDADIKKLTVSQKKVVVLLSEFLLAREYF